MDRRVVTRKNPRSESHQKGTTWRPPATEFCLTEKVTNFDAHAPGDGRPMESDGEQGKTVRVCVPRAPAHPIQKETTGPPAAGFGRIPSREEGQHHVAPVVVTHWARMCWQVLGTGARTPATPLRTQLWGRSSTRHHGEVVGFAPFPVLTCTQFSEVGLEQGGSATPYASQQAAVDPGQQTPYMLTLSFPHLPDQHPLSSIGR